MSWSIVLAVVSACSSARPVRESPVENRVGEPVALPRGLEIAFARGPCTARCPVYMATIHRDGSVAWDGLANVRVIGKASVQLERTKLAELAVAIDGARFFEREFDGRLPCDSCAHPIAGCDASSFTILVTRDDKTNEVHDPGCATDELDDLRTLERMLQQIATGWIGA